MKRNYKILFIILFPIIILVLINKYKQKNLKFIFLFKNNPYFINNIFKNVTQINKYDLKSLIEIKKTKIENIFILISIMPFLNSNSIIINKENLHFELYKNIFNNKLIKNKFIKINQKDFYIFTQKFELLLNYKWEIIPKLNFINYIRFIINNYYNELCLEIFDKSLNSNLKYYIKENKNNLSFNEIAKLMSKFIFISFYRKFGNL